MTNGGRLSNTQWTSCSDVYHNQIPGRLQPTTYHKGFQWGCEYHGSATPSAAHYTARGRQQEPRVFSISWGSGAALEQTVQSHLRSCFFLSINSHVLSCQNADVHCRRMPGMGNHKILCCSEWSQSLHERTGADRLSAAGLPEKSLFSKAGLISRAPLPKASPWTFWGDFFWLCSHPSHSLESLCPVTSREGDLIAVKAGFLAEHLFFSSSLPARLELQFLFQKWVLPMFACYLEILKMLFLGQTNVFWSRMQKQSWEIGLGHFKLSSTLVCNPIFRENFLYLAVLRAGRADMHLSIFL